MNNKAKANNLLTNYITAISGAGALGAGVGAVGGSLMFEADQASKPSYAQRRTVGEHALSNGEGWDRDTERDYAMIEGIRQAMMGERMNEATVDEMMLAGEVSPRVAFLLGDIHEFGARNPDNYNDPRYPAMQEMIKIERIKNRQELGLE
jgi:hypothetical protein